MFGAASTNDIDSCLIIYEHEARGHIVRLHGSELIFRNTVYRARHKRRTVTNLVHEPKYDLLILDKTPRQLAPKVAELQRSSRCRVRCVPDD